MIMEMKKIDPTVYVQVKLQVTPQHEYSVTILKSAVFSLSLSLSLLKTKLPQTWEINKISVLISIMLLHK